MKDKMHLCACMKSCARNDEFKGYPSRIAAARWWRPDGHPVSKAFECMRNLIRPEPGGSARSFRLCGRLPGQSLAGTLAVSLSLAFLAGCAQQPSSGGGVWRKSNTSEYFSQKRYGKASPRVVRNGRRVPKGGGRRIIGRPYKVAGKRYYPRQFRPGQTQYGRASWYGDAFHGRKTANGEIYDMSSITAAHPTMPLPSYARVTNRKNGRSIIVRVNDRGPFHRGRVIDLSKRVADLLDFRRYGTANVKVEYLRPAGLGGSDDRKLVASLRTDGGPAQFDGIPSRGRTMVAGLLGRKQQARAVRRQTSDDRAVVMTSSSPSRVAGSAQSSAIARTTASSGAQPAGRTGVSAPVPQPRPFDLATIPGASTPIRASTNARRAGLAARNRLRAPVLRRVVFFAPFSPKPILASRLQKRGPFEGIDLTRLRPFRAKR